MNNTIGKKDEDVSFVCTPLQKEVIVSDFTPNTLLTVIAGPGSGKTRTLCSRLAYMMSKEGGGMKPNEILVLSLTNKSVDDFKYRLGDLVSDKIAANADVMTFHSLAASVLRKQYNNWRLVEEDDIKRLCEFIRDPKRNNKSFPIMQMKELIGKMHEMTPEQFDSYSDETFQSDYGVSKSLYIKIQRLIGAKNAFTYDNMLIECNRILRSDKVPEFIKKYKVIFVDEFQDAYPALISIITALNKGRHLTLAGDSNQSIYEFMGASPQKSWRKIASMYNSDKKHKIVLNQAFRSTPELLELSNKVLGITQINLQECVKESAQIAPIRKSFENKEKEHQFMYDEIARLVNTSHGLIKYSDFAILSATNRDIDNAYKYFEERNALSRLKSNDIIEINRLNSTPRWLRTNLSMLLQYMKVLLSPFENFPLLSSINLLHNVGVATIDNIFSNAAAKSMSAWEYLCFCIDNKVQISKYIREFILYVQNARSRIDLDDPNSIMLNLLEMAEKFGLKKQLISAKLSKRQKEEYQECLIAMHNSLKQFLNLKPEDQTLLEFYLNNFSTQLFMNPKSNFLTLGSQNKVNFSTIHTSKGLEFPIVFLLSENNFNISRYAKRRLVYVGMTRATSMLYFNKLDYQWEPVIDGPLGATDRNKMHALFKVRKATSQSSVNNYNEYKPPKVFPHVESSALLTQHESHKVLCTKAAPKFTDSDTLQRLLNVMGRSKATKVGSDISVKALKLSSSILSHIRI